MTAAAYKNDFIAFALERDALKFGEFELKSGRTSPYFFNAGQFNSGQALFRLGRFYAAAIMAAKIEFDVILGPAYKGIPLAAATAIALSEDYGIDAPYAFNRKEAKNHGEGGVLVGAPLEGRVLIVDDVITAGTAIREVMTLVENHGAQAVAVAVALDRQEKGKSELSAIQEIERDFDISVINIVSMLDLIEYLKNQSEPAHLEKIERYRQEYGVV